MNYQINLIVVYVVYGEMYPYLAVLDIVARVNLVAYFHFDHHQTMFEFLLCLEVLVLEDADDDADVLFYDYLYDKKYLKVDRNPLMMLDMGQI
jgi:hypothetical protein